MPAQHQKQCQAYRGEIYIMTSGKETHFMDADCTIEIWEKCYGPALAARRKSLGMTRANKACFVYDGFTGNEASASKRRREMLMEEHNVTTSQLEAHASARMQPCDAVHGFWRATTDLYEDVAFGFNDDPLARHTLEGFLCDEIGYAARDYQSVDHIIKAGLWAWRRMPRSITQWAWTSRGFCSAEEMATMNGIQPEVVFQNENKVKNSYAKYMQLEELPQVEPPPSSKTFDDQLSELPPTETLVDFCLASGDQRRANECGLGSAAKVDAWCH